MTCIVGLVTKDCMVMGGDSAVHYDEFIVSTIVPKVTVIKQVKGPDALIGIACASSISEALISFKIPEDKTPINDKDNREANYRFIVTKVIPIFRGLLKKRGCLEVANGMEKINGEILLAYRGWLYCIDNDLQVEAQTNPFFSIGSGEQWAIGALDYLHKNKNDDLSRLPPEQIVERVILVAERNCTTVRGPMKIFKICLDEKKGKK